MMFFMMLGGRDVSDVVNDARGRGVSDVVHASRRGMLVMLGWRATIGLIEYLYLEKLNKFQILGPFEFLNKKTE